MRAAEWDGEKAKNNTILLARDINCMNGFNTVQNAVIDTQLQLDVHALPEKENLIKLIRTDRWPVKMTALRENLLRSTIIFDEITKVMKTMF